MQVMMSDKEVKIIEGLLKPDFDCFEWGSGGSTTYFPKFVKSWKAYEDNIVYYDMVKALLPENALVTLVPIEDYTKIDGLYDFILVDGKRRKECLTEAFSHLKPQGVILLHDALRFEYVDWINDYPSEVLIEGEIPDTNNDGYFLHRGLRLYKSQ